MNLSLVDPFALAQDYPDTLTGTLRNSFPILSKCEECADSSLTFQIVDMRHVCALIEEAIS